MATKSKAVQATRKRHSEAFKAEALGLAQKVGGAVGAA